MSYNSRLRRISGRLSFVTTTSPSGFCRSDPILPRNTFGAMPIVARKKAETKGAAAVAIVDAVDERREFLAPIIVGREQIRLVIIGRHQVEQHDADGKRFVARHARPDFLEAGEQKAG